MSQWASKDATMAPPKWGEDYFVRKYNPISEWKMKIDFPHIPQNTDDQMLLSKMGNKMFYKGVFKPAKRTGEEKDLFEQIKEIKKKFAKLPETEKLKKARAVTNELEKLQAKLEAKSPKLNEIDPNKEYQSELYVLQFAQTKFTWRGRFISISRVVKNVINMEFVTKPRPKYNVSIRQYKKKIGLNIENEKTTSVLMKDTTTKKYEWKAHLSKIESIKITNARWHEVKITFKPNTFDDKDKGGNIVETVNVVQILFVKPLHVMHFVLALMNRIDTSAWTSQVWQSIYVRDGMLFKMVDFFPSEKGLVFEANNDHRHNFSSQYRSGTLQLADVPIPVEPILVEGP